MSSAEDSSADLCEAAMYGRLTHVQRLVECGTDPNQRSRGQTALHFAIQNMHVECAKVLLDAKANINSVDTYGQTPLHWAVRHRIMECLHLLLAYGGCDLKVVNWMGETVEDIAKHYGDADLVLAVTWNKLPADAVPEVAPPTPGAPHVALAALRKAEDSSALCTAACEGDLPGLRGWLKAGVAPDAYWRGTPALLHACAASSEECARALLDAGAPVTALDTHGQTALHWACRMGHEGCTRLLLERGVDVAVRDWMGQTAQDVAAGKGHLAVARLVGAAEARRGPGGAESAAGPAEDGGGAAGRGMDYGAALVAQAEGHAAAEGRPRRFLDDDGHVIATEARDLAGLRIATAKHLRDD